MVWVDVPEGDPDAVRVLTEVFCFHLKAVADAVSRSPVPKCTSTPTHWTALIVLLAVMSVSSALLLLWAKRHGWW